MGDEVAPAAGPACRATGLCAITYVLILLLLPPVGWWLVAHTRWSEGTRRTLVFLTALWFGLWPLLAWRELGRPLLAVVAVAVALLVLAGLGTVRLLRRVFRRRLRRPVLTGRIVGGLVSGLLLVALVCGCTLAGARRDREQVEQGMAEPRTFGPAHLDIVEGLPILHLYGTPEEMGRQYGTILRPSLEALFRYFDRLMPRALYRHLRERAMEREKRLPDHYRRELKAVAEASGVPHEVLVTANLTPRMHCTVLLAWGEATADGAMVFARNSEYFSMGLKDCGSLIIVWHPADGQAHLSLNFLGMIGTFNGANAAGLCCGNLVVFNARHNDLNEVEGALPIQFILREAGRTLKTADALRDDLLKRPVLMPVQVAMADAKQAHIVELGTHSTGERRPTRHTLAAGNFFHDAKRRNGWGPDKFRRRYDQLIAFVEKRHGRIDATNITEALYNARSKAANIHSMVFEPAPMKMHVSFNRFPAAAGPYVELDLKTLFNAPPAEPRQETP